MRYLARWTPEEDAYLGANYPHASLVEMSRHLGRTVKALQRRAQSLGHERTNTTTKGMKFPNRQKPRMNAKRATERHELYQVVAGWVR